ncbi:MAG: Gfo/Idh/MocA family oxidoreductase [Bacteroidota bacterium]
MTNKRIALIGCGIWGLKILRDLQALACVVSVFDPDPERELQATAAGAVDFSTEPLTSSDYDGIIVATPSSTHRTVLEAIDHLGLPIFLEKPLTTNYPDALALQQQLQSEVFLMHVWLYHPGIQALAEIAQSGELGEVLGLRTTRANWTSPRRDTDSVWNLSPHDLTITQAILGYLPPARAAVLETPSATHRGMLAILGQRPYSIIEVSNRYERKIREVRLHCSEGIAVLRDEKVRHLDIYRGDEHSQLAEAEKRPFANDYPLLLELQEFIAYLEGGSPPRSSLADGVKIVKAIDELITLAQQ